MTTHPPSVLDPTWRASSTTPRSSRPATRRCTTRPRPRTARRERAVRRPGRHVRGPRHRPARWSAGTPAPAVGGGDRRRRPDRRPAGLRDASWALAIAGLEIALRDLDDLGRQRPAGGRRGRRGPRDGSSTTTCRSTSSSPALGSEPTAGWLAAADEVAAAELRLKFRTGGTEAHAVPRRPRRWPAGSTRRSTARRRSSAPPGCTTRSGTPRRRDRLRAPRLPQRAGRDPARLRRRLAATTSSRSSRSATGPPWSRLAETPTSPAPAAGSPRSAPARSREPLDDLLALGLLEDA